MKHPPELLDVHGKARKGRVVLTAGEVETTLNEFGTWVENSQTNCYVLTSPGDVIAVRFELRPEACDFVDLVVDGIRRDSIAINRQSGKIFRGAFERVCHQTRIYGPDKRKVLKSCEMIVRERSTKQGVDIPMVNTVR